MHGDDQIVSAFSGLRSWPAGFALLGQQRRTHCRSANDLLMIHIMASQKSPK